MTGEAVPLTGNWGRVTVGRGVPLTGAWGRVARGAGGVWGKDTTGKGEEDSVVALEKGSTRAGDMEFRGCRALLMADLTGSLGKLGLLGSSLTGVTGSNLLGVWGRR